ncbi:MAG: hypothetical protein HFH26_07795 [Clostridiaceae bacterium]|nr:hypothetical protein [Clostridiaceae bacterium]
MHRYHAETFIAAARFDPPSFWRVEAAPMNKHIQPSSRPQAMDGSPEGQVPLALSA